MTKTYESIRYPQLQTKVLLKGKLIYIGFTGALTGRNKQNGRFTTSDPDLIEAIESDSGFNKEFRLVHSTEPAPAPKQEETPPPVNDEGNGADSGAGAGADSTPPANSQPITNLQTLKSFLMKNHGVTADEVKNKALIIAKATELGVDTSGIK